MAKVCFIVGLAGSGKTYLAEKMKWDWHCDENFAAPDPIYRDQLIENLKNGMNCTVSEPNCVTEQYRRHIADWITGEVEGVEIEWIFFEKDLDAANSNCRRRPKGKGEEHVRINEILYPAYTIPPDVEVLPIHRI